MAGSPRMIRQIALDSHPRESSPLYALCNDGSVWQFWKEGARRKWIKVPPIPQDEEPSDAKEEGL